MNPLALHELSHFVGDTFTATIKDSPPAKNAAQMMIFNDCDGYLVGSQTDIGLLFAIMMDGYFKKAYQNPPCLSDDDVDAFMKMTHAAKTNRRLQLCTTVAVLLSEFAARTKLIEEIAQDLPPHSGAALLPERPLYDAMRPFTALLLHAFKTQGHSGAKRVAYRSSPLLDVPRAQPIPIPPHMMHQFCTLMASDAITNQSALRVLRSAGASAET